MRQALLSSLCLYHFKNHSTLTLELESGCIVLGQNGAGKSNLLESIYLLVNGILPAGRTVDQTVTLGQTSGFVRAQMLLESGLTPELAVSLGGPKRIAYLIQGESTTRPKYLAKHGYRAVLFTPIEMNLLYLGPSLRRDFLDEVLLLSHLEFLKVRRDYLAALRSRNALLKSIAEGRSRPDELDAWDVLFLKKASEYYRYRKRLIDFLREKLPDIGPKVRQGCQLTLRYETKVPFDGTTVEIEAMIGSYLASHREKDILIGHTCLGPHLDDFGFYVLGSDRRTDESECMNTADFLSR